VIAPIWVSTSLTDDSRHLSGHISHQMAKQKGNFKDFANEFDEFDEQELEYQYGVKVQNKGRTPKKQKKIKFDGDDIQW